MRQYQIEIMNAIIEHFPDGVDVAECQNKIVHEVSTAGLTNPSTMDKEIGQVPIEHEELRLEEIEPETGIYAAMSSVTRRVYVCVDYSELGVM